MDSSSSASWSWSSSPESPRSNRQRNRSSEEEYAGPLQYETPATSVSPESTPQKRLKRSGGSSDENQKPSQVHSLTVEDYRIAGPIYMPIPVRCYGLVDQRYRRAWDAGLESDVHQILHSRNIFRSAINLEKRGTVHIQAALRSADYIFIEVTEPSESAQWLSAANEILASCRHKGLDGLNVEIADPRGLAPTISATISSTLSIVCEWNILLPGIMEALKPNVEWLTIDLVNRMPGTDFASVSNTSFVPTILIMIQENTKESYTAARDKICGLLDPRFPEVAVEVIRGSLDGCAGTQDLHPVFEHHEDKLWQDEGYMGASIQPADTKSGGTLGCFIKLRHPNGVCSTYGLTNFHVVMPNYGDMANHDPQTVYWIQNGLRPGFGRSFQINMPSEIDLDAARTNYVQIIKAIKGDVTGSKSGNKHYLDYHAFEAQGENPELCMPMRDVKHVKNMIGEVTTSQARINAIDRRRNNIRLGVVYAGSGIRRSRSQQIVDWALISVDSARIPAANELPFKIMGSTVMKSSQMNRIGSLALAQEVFKIGRRSNQTRGYVNPVKTTKLMTWENRNGTLSYAVGHAWAVMNRKAEAEVEKDRRGEYFSEKGDSGSAVFTENGKFVGLLHSGAEYWREFSYVTSAQDLVEDIKYITGAIEVSML